MTVARCAAVVGAALWLITSSACLVGELQGVPCGDDDECATDHFCDLTVKRCQAETETVSAPLLDVSGIVDSNGDVVFSPFIDRVGEYDMAMVVENVGGLTAVDIRVELSELACLGLRVDDATIPGGIVPGGQARIAFSMSPNGTCGTPLVIDWFFLYSGRGSRGAFNVNINRADAGAN